MKNVNLWEIRNDETNKHVFTRNFDEIEMTVFNMMADDDFNQFLLDGLDAVTIIGEVAKFVHGDSDVFYGVLVAGYDGLELDELELSEIEKHEVV